MLRSLLLDGATVGDHLDALLAADHRCYPRLADRLSDERARMLCDAASLRLRLWFDGSDQPCGYTAVHTLSAGCVEALRRPPTSAANRAFIYPAALGEEAAGIYLFNYSIAPEWRQTADSRTMIQELGNDLAAMPQKLPLLALCVSDSGLRVATRFGLQLRAKIEVGGEEELLMWREP